MALGALIGAYQEDDSGGLRALLPLAGRTLIEYQARCAAAAGAAPVVVIVERIPVALNDAFERLRGEGINLIPVSDSNEAASRFEPGAADPADCRRLRSRHAVGRASRRGRRAGHRHRPRRRGPCRVRAARRDLALGRGGAGRRPHARRDRGDARRLGSPIDPAAAHGPGRRGPHAGQRCALRQPVACHPSGGNRRFRAPTAGRLARRSARLGQPLHPADRRGIRHRAADGNRGCGPNG